MVQRSTSNEDEQTNELSEAETVEIVKVEDSPAEEVHTEKLSYAKRHPELGNHHCDYPGFAGS